MGVVQAVIPRRKDPHNVMESKPFGLSRGGGETCGREEEERAKIYHIDVDILLVSKLLLFISTFL